MGQASAKAVAEVTPDKVRAKLKSRVEAAGSQSALAEAWGISETHLSDIVWGRRPIGNVVMRELGLRKVVSYELIDDRR